MAALPDIQKAACRVAEENQGQDMAQEDKVRGAHDVVQVVHVAQEAACHVQKEGPEAVHIHQSVV